MKTKRIPASDLPNCEGWVKYEDLREEFKPIDFFPVSQEEHPDPVAKILIRSHVPLAGLSTALKRTVSEVDPEIAIEFHVFKTQIREGLLRERLMATLAGYFGLLAALLATIGVYGAMSYTVARRRNEIGIRMALGADRRDVLLMILREAAWLLGIGLAAGAVLTLAAGRAASSMLFELKAYDPATMIAAMLLLAVAAIAASYLPALRAARLDPMVALRDE